MYEQVSNLIHRGTRVAGLGRHGNTRRRGTGVRNQRHLAPGVQVSVEPELQSVWLVIIHHGAQFGCDEHERFEGIDRQRLDREARMVDGNGVVPRVRSPC